MLYYSVFNELMMQGEYVHLDDAILVPAATPMLLPSVHHLTDPVVVWRKPCYACQMAVECCFSATTYTTSSILHHCCSFTSIFNIKVSSTLPTCVGLPF